MVIGFDNSADYNGWPIGQILKSSWSKFSAPGHISTSLDQRHEIVFPNTPFEAGTETAINEPLFLGCKLEKSYPASRRVNNRPLIVYMPNAYYSSLANISTFNAIYTRQLMVEIMENGYNVATRGNSSLSTDGYWDKCIGCAIVKRSLDRSHTPYPEICTRCYNRYCFQSV